MEDNLLALINRFLYRNVEAHSFVNDYIRLWGERVNAINEQGKQLKASWPERYDLQLRESFSKGEIGIEEFYRRASALWGYDWWLSLTLGAIHSSCDRLDFPNSGDSLNAEQLRAEIIKYLLDYRAHENARHLLELIEQFMFGDLTARDFAEAYDSEWPKFRTAHSSLPEADSLTVHKKHDAALVQEAEESEPDPHAEDWLSTRLASIHKLCQKIADVKPEGHIGEAELRAELATFPKDYEAERARRPTI